MFYARIHEDKLVSGLDRIKWEIFVFQCLAVKTDKATLLSENRSELVHDAAVHAAIVVLSGLSDLGKFELVDHIVEQIIERIGESAFQCC